MKAEIHFWIEALPSGDFLWGYLWLIIFMAIIFIPHLLKTKAKGNKYLKKSLRKKLWPFYLIGGVGLVLVLSRFSEIPIISMRLWLLLVLAIGGSTLVYLLWKIGSAYKKRLKSVERETQKK